MFCKIIHYNTSIAIMSIWCININCDNGVCIYNYVTCQDIYIYIPVYVLCVYFVLMPAICMFSRDYK